MPSGNTANLSNFAGSYEYIGDPISFQGMQSPGAIYQQNDTNLYISNFEVVGGVANSSAFVPWPNSSTVASECALWICVQAFELSMINANQTQTVIQEFSQIHNKTSAMKNGLSYFETLTFQDIPRTMNPRLGGTYTVGWEAFLAFQGYLGPMFTGSVFLLPESKVASSDVVEALWTSALDLNKRIKTIATSLTNEIRADKVNGDQNATMAAMQDAVYHGQAYQLGYEVRWPWIILPVALVLWSLVILGAIMIKTANRSEVRAWKGSPLAILFMDVDDEIRKRAVGQLDVCDGLSKSVGGMKVVMGADEVGRRHFRRV